MGLRLREIADEHLGRGVEVVGHDVEVAIVVEVEDDRGPAGARRPYTDLPLVPLQTILTIDSRAWFPESRSSRCRNNECRSSGTAGFYAEQNSASRNFFPSVIQKQRVDAVTVWEAHAGSE